MHQSTPRTAATKVLADQRPHLPWPYTGGWTVAPPSGLRRYHAARGPHQASENGRGAGVRGLGQGSPAEAALKTGVMTAGAIATGVAATGGIWGASAALAIPLIGAAVAGVVLALTLLFNRKGPKQRVATTEIVNKVEPLLQENLAGYMAGPRTVSSQAQALENFKAGWAYVVEYCDTPAMGNPGQACVRDRQPGGQWDWKSYYYDPIANDMGVIPDPEEGSVVTRNADGTVTVTPPAGTALGLPAAVAGIPASLLIAGAAIVAAMTMGGKR